jgi:hypothetical protein
MRLFFLLIFTGAALSLGAQTADELDLLLETREISFAQASRFVLAVADVADERTEAGAMYALAMERGWLPERAAMDSSIKLGELCFLIMGAFDMKGSFLYNMVPGPRYAYRELDYLKLIPGRRDPGTMVSGERLLQILELVSSYQGGSR